MTEENTTPVEPAETVEGEGDLGDPGKRALDRMKQERNEARNALKAFESLGLPAEKLEEIVKQHTEYDQEAALAKARSEGATEARTGFQRQLASMAVQKVAADLGFYDASDAVALLGDKVGEIKFDGDDVDLGSVELLLNAVVEKKPHLVREEGVPAESFGLGAQGAPLALNGDGIENALRRKLGI